jgi:hypothetical protein
LRGGSGRPLLNLNGETTMYKVVIECEMSEEDYENRNEIAKEITSGKIDKYETLISHSLHGLYHTLRFRYRRCIISNELKKWVNPVDK